MSIKIYQAVKVPVSGFNAFAKFVREETLQMALAHTKALLGALKAEALLCALKAEKVKELKEGRYVYLKNHEKGDLIIRWYYTLELFKEHNDSIDSLSLFSLESGWNFFVYEDYFYGWPWGTFILPEEKYLNYPGTKIRDYCYWDNVDRPDNVTEGAWRERGERWKYIIDNLEKNKLVFCTVSFAPMAYDSQIWLENKILLP